jgi:hypothetical protein
MEKDRKIVDEISNNIDVYGGVTLFNHGNEISITSIDPKEGYSYIASKGDAKFNNSRTAVEWAIEELHGVDEWE